MSGFPLHRVCKAWRGKTLVGLVEAEEETFIPGIELPRHFHAVQFPQTLEFYSAASRSYHNNEEMGFSSKAWASSAKFSP